MKQNIQAQFTNFDIKSNWVSGIVDKYKFEAKLFDVGSSFGIKNGRVSKLSIWDENVRHEKQNFFSSCIVNYDRGWDIRPKKTEKVFFDAVMSLLESSPKRFTQ